MLVADTHVKAGTLDVSVLAPTGTLGPLRSQVRYRAAMRSAHRDRCEQRRPAGRLRIGSSRAGRHRGKR